MQSQRNKQNVNCQRPPSLWSQQQKTETSKQSKPQSSDEEEDDNNEELELLKKRMQSAPPRYFLVYTYDEEAEEESEEEEQEYIQESEQFNQSETNEDTTRLSEESSNDSYDKVPDDRPNIKPKSLDPFPFKKQMIFCVSRPHSKSQHQSPNNSRKDKMSVKHPETNSKTILDLYVSNNLMRNLLSQPSIQIDNKISPSQDDQSFNSYRQQLQSNITERKTNKLLDDQLDDTTLSMTIKQKKTRNSQIKYVCDAFNQENPSSFTNLTEEDMEVHMPMRFKPFSFKD